jgi:hypothetical protein
MLGWIICQHYALLFRERYPGRMHIVRAEDVMADARSAFAPVLEAVGVQSDADSLEQPSWNGRALDEVYPWGTIRAATPDANLATAEELSEDEQAEVTQRAWQYLDTFGYREFLARGEAGPMTAAGQLSAR